MNLTWKQYVEIGCDVLAVFLALLFGHWVGFAIAAFTIFLVYAYKALMLLQTTRDVLLSRLPERCAMCHREILDETGMLEYDFFDELKTYHEHCAERLDAMKERQNALGADAS
jgi:hypothetical protein